MQNINKQYILLSTILFTVLLAWCSFKPNTPSGQNTWMQVDTGSSISTDTKVLIISWTESTKYLSWYTWDTVVITTDNSGAVVIQPWDELLYRNEVYWFQVLLGKEWKGGQVCRVIGEWLWDITALIRFSIKHPINNNVVDIGCVWNPWFESHIQLNIYTTKDYMAYKTKPLDLWSKETPRSIIQKQTYGGNNMYYFVVTQSVPDNRIKQLYPYIACKPLGKSGEYDIVSCLGRINQLFTNKLNTFNIK